jgi:hypothetical protein
MPSIINATTTAGVAVTGDNSGALALQTNNGTTAVTIDTSQNVGIGTASPVQKLDVSGTAVASTINARITNTDSNSASRAAFQFKTGASSNVWQAFARNNQLVFGIDAVADYVAIASNGTTTISANASADQAMYLNNSSANPYGVQCTFLGATPNNTTNTFFIGADSTNTKVLIYSSGTISNRTGTYNTISDAKLKENISDATPKLNKLMDVKVRNYNLIGDELKQIGFVAQELETIFPSLIDNVPDLDENKQPTGEVTKGVKLTVMIPILVKAIQELNAKVEAQAVRIAELEGAK